MQTSPSQAIVDRDRCSRRQVTSTCRRSHVGFFEQIAERYSLGTDVHFELNNLGQSRCSAAAPISGYGGV